MEPLKYCHAVSGTGDVRLRVAGVQLRTSMSEIAPRPGRFVLNLIEHIALNADWPGSIKPDIIFLPEYAFEKNNSLINQRVDQISAMSGISIGYGAYLNSHQSNDFNFYRIAHPNGHQDYFLKKHPYVVDDYMERPDENGYFILNMKRGFTAAMSICMDILDEEVQNALMRLPLPDIFVVPVAVEHRGVEEYSRVLTGLLGTGNYLFVNDCGFYASDGKIAGSSAFHRVNEEGHSCFDLDHNEGIIVVDLFKQSKI